MEGVNGSNVDDMTAPSSFTDVEKVPYISMPSDLGSSLIIGFAAFQSSSKDSISREHLKRYPRSRIHCKNYSDLKKVGSLQTRFFKVQTTRFDSLEL